MTRFSKLRQAFVNRNLSQRPIPYGRHDVDDADIAAVVRVLRGDWLATGPTVDAFEKAISRFVGTDGAVAVSSGTAALHSSFAAIELGPGDEVVLAPNSFVATGATAVAMGATLVFADIQADTGNICPNAARAVITDRTAAIVAVDYAGHPCDLDELRDVASEAGAYLIEDAAHSFGSLYRGRSVGSIADLTAFSFYPTKNMTTGEGGAITARDPELLGKARRFSRHGVIRASGGLIGSTQPWWYTIPELGLNYRLSDIHAALGLSQLERVQEFRARRSELKALYDARLAELSSCIAPMSRTYVEPMWHLYAFRVPAQSRDQIVRDLQAAGVGVQVNYIPMYWHEALAQMGYERGLCPVAEDFYAQEVSLPLHTKITAGDFDYICEQVKRTVELYAD